MSEALAIHEAYEKFIEAEERRSGGGQRDYVYASAWHACTRAMALDMLRPDAKQPFPADTLANFRRGNDRARDIKSDFTRAGRYCTPPFDIVGAEERFEIRDRKGRIAIVGKVDFRLQFAGSKLKHPVETKSFHPNLVQGVKDFNDLLNNRWLKKASHQLLAYLFATNEPLGFMLLDRPGIPRLIEVRLFDHLDKIEDFLNRAEIAMDARELWKQLANGPQPVDEAAFKLPPFIDDPDECKSCAFLGSACNPPLNYDGSEVITDEALLANIERRAALEEAAKEFAGLDDEVKERLRGIPMAIAGKFLIEGKPRKTTKTVWPSDEMKRQCQVSDPNGGWVVKITRITE